MESAYLYKKKIPFVDLSRCMATIQIVLFHYVCATQFSDRYVLLWGREGVAIFFMISGCGLINKYYYNFSLKEFFKRRFLGIMVPFYIAYICIWLWQFYWSRMTVNLSGTPLRNIIFTLVGMDGLVGVYGVPTFYQIGEWYLGVMIIVYILFPIWLRIFRKYPKLLVVGLLILRAGIIINNVFEPLPVCFNPIVALSNFTIGAYLILLFSKNDTYKKDKRFVLLGIIILILGELIGHIWDWQDCGELLAGIGLFIIYIYISELRIINGDFFKLICCISYEIFLVHHIIIYKMAPIINDNYSIIKFVFGGFVIVITIIVTAYILKKAVDYVSGKKPILV